VERPESTPAQSWYRLLDYLYLYLLPPHCRYYMSIKVKVVPYSIRTLGPELIPVSYRQVIRVINRAAIAFRYSPRLPSQPKSVTALWSVPNYTVWWQRHMCVSNLPRIVTWKWNGRDSNPRPLDREFNTLPLHHHAMSVSLCNICRVIVIGGTAAGLRQTSWTMDTRVLSVKAFPEFRTISMRHLSGVKIAMSISSKVIVRHCCCRSNAHWSHYRLIRL